METLIELTGKEGLNFYYVNLAIDRGMMHVVSPKGLIKSISRAIPLKLVKEFVFENSRVTFSYNHEQYTFVDYGNGVLNYMNEELV